MRDGEGEKVRDKGGRAREREKEKGERERREGGSKRGGERGR